MVRSLASPRITVRLSGSLTNTLTDGSSTSIAHPSLNYAKTLTSGIEENQANRAWQSISRSLAGGANETLDLFDMAGVDIGAGAGLDGLGQSVSPFEEIVAIAIVNENAVDAAGQLEIEPGAGAGWDPIGIHTVALGGALRGQGMLLKTQLAADGYNITDVFTHTIKFTANGGDVNYSLYIMARHDDEESSSSTSSVTSSSSSSVTSSSSSLSSSSWSSGSPSSSSSTSSVTSSSSSVTSSSSSSTSSVTSSSSTSSATSSSSSSSATSSSSSSLSSSSWSTASIGP